MVKIKSHHRRSFVLLFIALLANFLAQPNELFLRGNWLFGLVGYVAIYLLLVQETKSIRGAGIAGSLYGCINTVTSYFWLANFGDFSLWTIGSVSAIYMIMYSVLFIIIFHLSAKKHVLVEPFYILSREGRQNAPLCFALTWTAFEFFKSRGYLGFPWNLAAFPFHDWLALNQVAELAGIWPISFTILLLQASLGELLATDTPVLTKDHHIYSKKRRGPYRIPILNYHVTRKPVYGLFALCILTIFTMYGIFRMNELSDGDDKRILVLLVQQNRDTWNFDNRETAMEQLVNLSTTGIEESKRKYGRKPDLVSWSETSLNYFYDSTQLSSNSAENILFRKYLETTGTKLITGAPLNPEKNVYMNGTIYVDSSGVILGKYGKIHLIPFAEHVPFFDIPFLASFLENVIGIPSMGWQSGEEVQTFYLEDHDLHIGTPICFEDTFSNISRSFIRNGADVLLVLSNTSWSRTRSSQMQHFVAARYRAIENRRVLLRSTNGGVTSIVLPDGRLQSEIPMFESNYLLAEVKIANELPNTFYTVYGDWAAWLMIISLLLFLLTNPVFLQSF